MKLIVGLGNPGSEYARTRHNVGFMVVDRLVERHGLGPPRSRFHSASWEGHLAGERCVLLQPMTYMNRSGLAVSEAVRFYKLDPAVDVLVLVDDVALPCGRIRLRGEGSAGGHNGLADIEQALATRSYPRLRIGIDAPGRIPQRDYVLGRFTPEQWAQVDEALDQAVDAVMMWLREGLPKAMSLFNAKA